MSSGLRRTTTETLPPGEPPDRWEDSPGGDTSARRLDLVKLLFIGDVVGSPGRRGLENVMPRLREQHSPDLIVVNGENSAGGLGITEKTAKEIFACGADVITLGNHSYRQRESWEYLDRAERVIRPANYRRANPGKGYCVIEVNPADGSGPRRVAVINLIGKIGENLSIRRFNRVQAGGKVASYLHGGARIGVLVDLAGGDEALAKDIAMHIAAHKPVALRREQVSEELIAKERSIAEQKAAESGKPADIVAKMVEGSVQKYLKEVTLLGQPFVKDEKQTVEQLLKSRQAKVNVFHLYVVGEGIEKKQSDFAAEVAAQVSAAR